MPLHDYKCMVCFHRYERMVKVVDLDKDQRCTSCGAVMLRQVCAPYVQGDYEPYESPVVPGKWIKGRREHEEHLRETGCRVLEPGETRSYQKQLERENEEFDKKIEETADQLITSLPTEKRDRLAAEMEGGLDAQIVRSTPTLK